MTDQLATGLVPTRDMEWRGEQVPDEYFGEERRCAYSTSVLDLSGTGEAPYLSGSEGNRVWDRVTEAHRRTMTADGGCDVPRVLPVPFRVSVLKSERDLRTGNGRRREKH